MEDPKLFYLNKPVLQGFWESGSSPKDPMQELSLLHKLGRDRTS
jgi:hypothetical protein